MFDDDPLTGFIIGESIDIHSVLGPDCLESSYHKALGWALRLGGFKVETQVPTPVVYRGLRIDPAYRIDMIVARCVIVEIKTVERLLPVHEAQLLTYMRLTDIHVGLLLNFRAARMKDGIRRLVL